MIDPTEGYSQPIGKLLRRRPEAVSVIGDAPVRNGGCFRQLRELFDTMPLPGPGAHGANCGRWKVPTLLAWPGAPGGTAVTQPVETTHIAPTILKLLGLNPNELQAVQAEGTQALY